MISRENYEKLEKLYGDVASWAIWKEPNVTPKSNTSDLSVFDDLNLLQVLNPQYVFVGLNASSTHGERRDGANRSWMNFHSDYARQNDYKLRYALMYTPYWGGYITDVIKKYPEVDSGKVREYLSTHPSVIRQNISEFEQELALLGKDPLLIAMGGATYEILKNNLGSKYRITQIKHYSFTIGKEDYRDDVLDILSKAANK
jgi:hypothetical protein